MVECLELLLAHPEVAAQPEAPQRRRLALAGLLLAAGRRAGPLGQRAPGRRHNRTASATPRHLRLEGPDEERPLLAALERFGIAVPALHLGGVDGMDLDPIAGLHRPWLAGPRAWRRWRGLARAPLAVLARVMVVLAAAQQLLARATRAGQIDQ